MTVNKTVERGLFEKDIHRRFPNAVLDMLLVIDINTGEYKSEIMESRWQGWLAAIEAVRRMANEAWVEDKANG